MISRSLGVQKLLVSLVIAGVLATVSCHTGPPDISKGTDQVVPSGSLPPSSPTDPSGPITARSSPPITVDEQREKIYKYCETASAGDPVCHTSRFGNNLRAADEFLDGVNVGPGGLKEMTATDDGFPAGIAVGNSVSLVNATLNIDISEEIPSGGACKVLMDRASQMGVVTDLEGSAQAFLILNPVVETQSGIHIGSTLADLQASEPVNVEEYGNGKIAYTVREDVMSHFENVEPGRAVLYYLSPDDVILMWVVGATSYVKGTGSETLCPAA